jgi:hypothetical protein
MNEIQIKVNKKVIAFLYVAAFLLKRVVGINFNQENLFFIYFYLKFYM